MAVQPLMNAKWNRTGVMFVKECAHHYLILVGRRHAAVIKIVPLSIVFVFSVRGIWAEDEKEEKKKLQKYLHIRHLIQHEFYS